MIRKPLRGLALSFPSSPSPRTIGVSRVVNMIGELPDDRNNPKFGAYEALSMEYLSNKDGGASMLLEGTIEGLARLARPHLGRSGRHDDRFLSEAPDTPLIRFLCRKAVEAAEACAVQDPVHALTAAVTIGTVAVEEDVRSRARTLAVSLASRDQRPSLAPACTYGGMD
jgi:hypothetical protein